MKWKIQTECVGGVWGDLKDEEGKVWEFDTEAEAVAEVRELNYFTSGGYRVACESTPSLFDLY